MATQAMIEEKTVRHLLSVSKSTLRRWAAIGYGPSRRKMGPRKIGYEVGEVEAFVASLAHVGVARAKAAR